MSIEFIKAEPAGVVNGKAQNRAEAMVSTTAELASLENVTPGSIALIKQTGEFYILDGDGKWYNQDGSGPASV